MSNWIEHLDELASVETDVKKKVAFQSSARLIKDLAKGGAELRAELAVMKAEKEFIMGKLIAASQATNLIAIDTLIEEAIEHANKIEAGL